MVLRDQVNTVPVFIVSSGRSGSQMMEKLIAAMSDYEVHHEYLCNIIQPAAVSYYLNLIDRVHIDKILCETYWPAVYYSNATRWIDSSNKASWLVEPLAALFPNAKFIHLIRDGRRVCSSYLNKLGNECYSDQAFKIFADYLAGDASVCPPPEKKYWWPPIANSGSLGQFSSLSQFEKITHHWVEINNQIEEGLCTVQSDHKLTVKLEDLSSSEAALRELLGFLNISFSEGAVSMMNRPHNVNSPVSFELTPQQAEQFWRIAENMMGRYGYSFESDYVVRY